MHMRYFSHQFIIAKGIAAVLKWKRQTIVSLPSKLILLSQCQLQRVNSHIRRTVGDETATSRSGKKPAAPSVRV